MCGRSQGTLQAQGERVAPRIPMEVESNEVSRNFQVIHIWNRWSFLPELCECCSCKQGQPDSSLLVLGSWSHFIEASWLETELGLRLQMSLEVRRKREGAFHYHAPRGLRIRRQYVIEYSLWFNEWKAGFHYSGKGLFSKATSCPPTICRAYLRALKPFMLQTLKWKTGAPVSLWHFILLFCFFLIERIINWT